MKTQIRRGVERKEGEISMRYNNFVTLAVYTVAYMDQQCDLVPQFRRLISDCGHSVARERLVAALTYQ